MKYCLKCGKPLGDDHIFCLYCGASQTEENSYTATEGTRNGLGMKSCTNCGSSMDAAQVFCPKCGAKQYIRETVKTYFSTPLVTIHRCKFYRLAECCFEICSDKVSAIGTAGNVNFFIRMTDLLAVSDYIGSSNNKGLKLTTRSNKSYCVIFPPEQYEFIPYVQMMLRDYSML